MIFAETMHLHFEAKDAGLNTTFRLILNGVFFL